MDEKIEMFGDDELIEKIKVMDGEVTQHYRDYCNAQIAKDDEQFNKSFALYAAVSKEFGLLMDEAHKRDIL